jgi:hypothetical protein
MQNWDAEFASRLPLYEPLSAYAAMLSGVDWPDLPQLQHMIDTRCIVTGGGQPLRVVEQAPRSGLLEDRYEARIYLRGELQIRRCDWHDLFNLLVWAAFPRAKTALNARHYRALLDQHARGAPNRGPAQDALTLFDEGGIVVASSDSELLDDLRAFEWEQLFRERRERVKQHMRWFLFGHAMYEKGLAPFDGITARGVLFTVDDAWLALPQATQLAALDERLATSIADAMSFRRTRDLQPVPILGIPGWWPPNEGEHYYANTDYFRLGRRGGRS